MIKTFTSKEIAERTNVSIPTLRYYESIGLLDSVQRAPNGHRRYTDDDLQQIEFLKRLRLTGMPIADRQCYVDLLRAGSATLEERRELLERYLGLIQEQIDALLKLAISSLKFSFSLLTLLENSNYDWS